MKKRNSLAIILAVLVVIFVPVTTYAGIVKGSPFPFDSLDPNKYTFTVQQGGFYMNASENSLLYQGCEFYLKKIVQDEDGNEVLEYNGEGSATIEVLYPEKLSREAIEACGKYNDYLELQTVDQKNSFSYQEDLDDYSKKHGDCLSYSTEDNRYSGDVARSDDMLKWSYTYYDEDGNITRMGQELTLWRPVPEFPGILIYYQFSLEQNADTGIDPNAFSSGCSMIDSIVQNEYKLTWDEYRTFDDAVTSSFVDSDASTEAGDSEFSVPSAVVLGLVSGVAAVGSAVAAAGAGAVAGSSAAAGVGAAAGSSVAAGAGSAEGALASSESNPSSADDEKKKREFKMIVGKDFGDAIRRGANPVKITARMVEEVEGKTKDRPDLTGAITAKTINGLVLDSLNFEGKFMSAMVHADDNEKSEKGSIIFTFTGEGGTFDNKINFRIVDKPSVMFPEQAPGSTGMYLPVIAGDGGTYKVTIRFLNAVSEPELIKFTAPDEFDIKYEEAEYERTYCARIKNHTELLQNVPFKKPEIKTVYLEASFSNGDVVKDSFYIEIHPKGLTARSYNLQDDRLLIDAREDMEATEWDYKLRPVPFEIFVATTEEKDGISSAKFLSGDEISVTFEKLTGDAFYAQNFDEAYKYHVDDNGEGRYDFVSEVVLSQVDEPYYMDMEVNGSAEGEDFTQFLPLTLIGQLPPKKPVEWEKEYEMLKKDLLYFGLSSNNHMRSMISKAKSLTANDLCMIRRAIIFEATSYYRNERFECMSLDASLGRYEFVFSSVKWIMDQAFSYLISTYFGEAAGPYVDAFASPMKDMIGSFLGELTASAYWGDKVKLKGTDILNVAITGVENSASNYMGDALKANPVSLKKIGGVCAGMLTIGFLKRYGGISDNGDYEGDIYNSLIKAFGDLATNVLKNMFSNYLGNVLKSDKGMCKSIGDFIGKHVVGDLKSADIAAKYLSETFGVVVSNVYDNVMKEKKDVVNEDGTFNIYITVGDSELKINPIANISAMAEIMYGILLKPFECVSKPLKVGYCEKYYPEK